jgi:hypothetical protein
MKKSDKGLDKALLGLEMRADKLGHGSLWLLVRLVRLAFESGLSEGLWGLLEGLSGQIEAYAVQEGLLWARDQYYPEVEELIGVRPEEVLSVSVGKDKVLGRMEFGEGRYVLSVRGNIRGKEVRADLSTAKKSAGRRLRGKGTKRGSEN